MARGRLRRLTRRVRVPAGLKRYTNPIVGRVPMPILSGVNRGRLWSVASAGSGYGTGRRAAAQMKLIAALIRRGDVVWDVGAHHGFVTLCASRCAGPEGKVHAFEPSVRNRWFLERHVAWNRLDNVEVHACAVGGFDGTASFGGASTSKQFRLGGGAEEVQVRTIGSLLAGNAVEPPSFMKIDIEGAEADLLEDGGSSLPVDARLLIAIHSAEVDERCQAALERMGFIGIPSRQLLKHRREGWRGDADLFCLHRDSPELPASSELLERSNF